MTKGTRKFSTAMSALLLAVSSNAALANAANNAHEHDHSSVNVVGHEYKVDLDFYLPKEQYNPAIPTPESVLGAQVGEWHVRHDQLVAYFKALAEASDRVSIKTIGRSHQNRELLHVYFSQPDNLNRLDDIKQARANYFEDMDAADNQPLIVNLNYSVHGDESSGSNASLLVGYYLAASNSPQVQKYLKDMVVIIDPSLNPDGLSRFAHWANQHKGMNLNKDSNNREHNQPWIRGRVNQYWFDLNRDWLLLQHPESRARIAEYQQWRPHVLTDHHEMGTNSTFFFQPGIPSRKNPLTPDKNVELTKELAVFHANAFDVNNTLYFTEEAFDDFYAGKGSTYPDLHASIGILFEQASSRGHLQESINGDLDFPTTIKHQVMSSFSTLEGSLANASKLKAFQQEFKESAKEIAKDADFDGYILSESKDKTRFHALIDLLKRHQIKVYNVGRDSKIDGKTYPAADSVYVPLDQPQTRLVQSVFSTQKSFNDNTFYDVSSWNLAYAFDVDFAKVESARKLRVSKQLWQAPEKQTQELSESYSLAIDWHDFNAPGLVYELLENGIKVRTSLTDFSAKTKSTNTQKQAGQKEQFFSAGTMLINAGLQEDGWVDKVQAALAKYPVKISAITSGLTSTGADLGSRKMMPVTLPKVLMVGGMGVNLYETGEAWYMLDRHVGFSPSIVNKTSLGRVDFAKYTHIVLPDGNYSSGAGSNDEKLAERLKTFVKGGGIVWGQKRGAQWLAKQGLLDVDTISQRDMFKRFEDSELRFGDKEALGGRQRVAGAFFETKLDMTHPLTFGLTDDRIALFKNRTDLILESNKPFSVVAQYTNKPLLSGYADDKNVEKIANAVGLVAQRNGRGVVIGMTDNPNFRAIMVGSNRLFVNSLFLANGIKY